MENTGKKNFWLPGLILLAAAVIVAYVYAVGYYKWIIPVYGIGMAAVAPVTAAGLGLLALAAGKPKKAAVLRAVLGSAAFMIFGMFAVSFLINNVLMHEGGAWLALLSTTALGFGLALFCVLRLKKLTGEPFRWKPLLGVALCLCLLVCGLLPLRAALMEHVHSNSKRMEAIPANLSVYTEKETVRAQNADLYVAPDGSDEADGSFDNPLATVEKARDLVRAMDKTGRSGVTVAVKAGEYRINGLTFTQADSGTPQCPVTYCAYGDGEVIFNGGVTLDPAAFRPAGGTLLGRLKPEAAAHVMCLDLTELGITAADYGRIYAIGDYNTAHFYDGDTTGPIWSELFVNDERYNLARYPDTGWLKTGALTQVGYNVQGNRVDAEYGKKVYVRNPVSDIYKIDRKLADRINGWATLEDVWMFGFWKYTWADGSTPISSFDYENRLLSPAYVSLYEAIPDAPYYFFNVLEELDAPGEWYLKRDNGLLFLYAPEDFEHAAIDLSLTTNTLLTGENVHDLVFTGFTFKGTRGDAISITGDRCTVSHCLIINIAGTALTLHGYDNLASENEITRTGMAAIVLDGGDEETLTPGNTKADNNLIHDWSEIYQTYQPAVSLKGVGNICSHNEIYNSPHEAITYWGNDHTIEYNLIHDVCLLSDDAGAVYAGNSWNMYGTVIRYNCIYNLGTPGEHSPQGIYMDDALSGQTIYGNLLVNMPCFGLQLGGGRDLIVKNNIVINTKGPALSFDQRAIDGALQGGWFGDCTDLWDKLNASPWQTAVWQAAWPQYEGLHLDKSRSDEPTYGPNAAGGSVTGNLFVNERGELGSVAENPDTYSDISGNAVYKMDALQKLFVDPANGDYTLREDAPVFGEIPGFEPIPLQKIGRY